MKMFLPILFALGATFCRAEIRTEKIVLYARSQIGITKSYDPEYRKLGFPDGDVPKSTGVCADVVIRALRPVGIDLQKEVHEDMLRDFAAYPQKWGLKRPDPNIDHRRVPNLMTYFQRKGYARPIDQQPEHYVAGDIVAWNLGGNITHIGIVSDKRTDDGVPLIIHNIGSGAQEENVLFQFQIIGHYRVK